MANRLALTPRTLQRRLADHGTTWQRELDQARNAHAEVLKSAGTPMAAIAARLGYSDQRALRRAMRRWTDGGSDDGRFDGGGDGRDGDGSSGKGGSGTGGDRFP
ncbi:MAG: AraC family transcriptional regulator [Catenulispora sp.]|nr:AraC family transcriptional regulator [Catenulispora sp.]